ncbi:YybH family protein [Pseudemcibacter aquimaris]|uniref:YybH family protein n=1 Tax=Pseudemcibacter aquimaris TaxID=2857064 RepID=UPI00201358A6|nr:nuclear transport factor 2 family protein [Pseudemcibacter aquimaris]MCC3860811.1 nuclear transport factor 2 family protein [Pseudemcibacter aquimaris]WDU59631.1 nuclear transport factor 2 family protein [Pseudemcibacter aquimaris]
MKKTILITLSFLLAVFAQTINATAADDAPPVIAEWQKFWNTYDLDQMNELFINSDSLTYFSSEKEGLIRGYEEMIEHHKGFGFVPGGKQSEAKLWLENIETDYIGDIAVVAAIWKFDVFRDGKQVLMRGPVSFICSKDSNGKFKLHHVNFSNY